MEAEIGGVVDVSTLDEIRDVLKDTLAKETPASSAQVDAFIDADQQGRMALDCAVGLAMIASEYKGAGNWRIDNAAVAAYCSSLELVAQLMVHALGIEPPAGNA